jgi:hypothetical protein
MLECEVIPWSNVTGSVLLLMISCFLRPDKTVTVVCLNSTGMGSLELSQVTTWFALMSGGLFLGHLLMAYVTLLTVNYAAICPSQGLWVGTQ